MGQGSTTSDTALLEDHSMSLGHIRMLYGTQGHPSSLAEPKTQHCGWTPCPKVHFPMENEDFSVVILEEIVSDERNQSTTSRGSI